MARALSNLGKAVLQQKAFGQQGTQGMIAVAANKNCEHTSFWFSMQLNVWDLVLGCLTKADVLRPFGAQTIKTNFWNIYTGCVCEYVGMNDDEHWTFYITYDYLNLPHGHTHIRYINILITKTWWWN